LSEKLSSIGFDNGHNRILPWEMNIMETLEARFQIVTPMFLGDANQKADDGIRPPSVKGALRFWWRALNWGRFRAQSSCDKDALSLLHTEECRIFGTAGNDNGGGQGCFLLTVMPGQLTSTESQTVHENFKTKQAARYLGYGLMVAFGNADGPKPSGQLVRDCFNEGQEFTVTLIFRNRIETSVKEAFLAWGLLGGLGSRSRHGMGSIALSSLRDNEENEWVAPNSPDNYVNQIKELFSKVELPGNSPPFSAFWENARIDCLLSANNCYTVLDEFGKAMLMYRSWGKTSMSNRLPGGLSEKRFVDDHNWCKADDILRARAYVNFHPLRVVFGLPHNYGKPVRQQVNGEQHERRSSPLLFHVHPVGASFLGISIYLPAKFLPHGEKIDAGGSVVPANIDWAIIPRFLDGNTGNPPGATKRFPSRVQVIP